MQGLDLFTIDFNSQGLKDFEQELKNAETNLDRAEKEVARLEKRFEDLSKSNGDNVEELVKVDNEIKKAKEDVLKFGSELNTLKGRSEYQILAMKKNFGSLLKTLGALAFVGATVKKSLDFYEQAEQLDFLAQKTGIATEKLQNLANATKKYGGSNEDTASTVENLRQKGFESAAGGSGQLAPRYAFDPENALLKISAKMETMKDDKAKFDYANSLGIDEATTRLLIQGTQKYREELQRTAKYKLYTKEDIQRMREYRQISGDIKMGTASIFGTIYRGLLPAITAVTKVIRSLTDWLAQHEGATKIIGILVAVTAAIVGVTTAIKLLSVAFKLLTANPIVLEILAIAAVITALIAIVDEFIVFLQGGDSIITDILEKLGFNAGEVRKSWLNSIEKIKQGFLNLIDFLKNIGVNIKEWWDNLIPDWAKGIFKGGANLKTTSETIKKGQTQISSANSNSQNFTPIGAMSTYAQTQSINNNTNQNTKYMSTAQNKQITVNSLNIQTQANNPQAVANSVMSTFNEIDNGRKI